MQGRETITVGSAGVAVATSGPGTVRGLNCYIQQLVLLIPPYPKLPTTHIMLKYKPDWIETFTTADDLCFIEYPDESIAEWHERLANIKSHS